MGVPGFDGKNRRLVLALTACLVAGRSTEHNIIAKTITRKTNARSLASRLGLVSNDYAMAA